jgi:hypothetical protein
MHSDEQHMFILIETQEVGSEQRQLREVEGTLCTFAQ